MLALTVLKPLVRGLLAAPHSTYQPPALTEALAGNSAGTPALDYDSQVAQARTLVAQDPARVAQVVKTWVGKDE